MSWEDSAPIERPCPCGKGKYAVITRSDDWNRHEERWEMYCLLCSEKYGFYASNYSRKGLPSTYLCWLPRSLLKELSVAAEELEKAKNELSIYAKAHYQERWDSHFSGKTKKAIWCELTEGGKHYPSLPAFYLQIRESSLEQQLARYFYYRDLPTVLRVLQLNASELHLRMEQVQELERALKDSHSNARQQAFV